MGRPNKAEGEGTERNEGKDTIKSGAIFALMGIESGRVEGRRKGRFEREETQKGGGGFINGPGKRKCQLNAGKNLKSKEFSLYANDR